MKRCITILLLVAVGVAGCKEKEKPKENQPPPPPTANEIRQEIVGSFPKDLEVPGVEGVPGDSIQKFYSVLKAAKNKHRHTENGPEGLNKVIDELRSRLDRTYNAEMWLTSAIYARGILILKDQDDVSAKRRYDRAMEEVNKPRVTLKGIVDPGEESEIQVMMDVEVPETGETHFIKPYIGDSFYDLKLLGVIGQNKGIRLLYEPTGEEFEVYTKR